MCVVVCWTQLLGAALRSGHSTPLKPAGRVFEAGANDALLCGKNTALGSGAASTWGWGGRSRERTQRGKAAGDGGFVSKGDAPCFYCAQGNTILGSIELLAVRAFSLYHSLAGPEQPWAPGRRRKGLVGNHLPLGTKRQELPGPRGLTRGVTQSWN